MKAFPPRSVLEIIAHNTDVFEGLGLTVYTSGGHCLKGHLVSMTVLKEPPAVLLQNSKTDEFHWVSISQIEAISTWCASQHQLAVLGEEDFDSLVGQPEPGKLALAKELNQTEARLAQALGKTIKLVLSEKLSAAGTPERALQLAVLRSVMSATVSLIEKHFSDDFAKKEINRFVDTILIEPAESQILEIEKGTLIIKCPWKDSKSRWSRSALLDSLNDCF